MLKLFLLISISAFVFAGPQKCGPNEVFNSCGSNVKKTCSERDPLSDRMCHAVCECKEDFVTEGGKCIPTSDCKKYCGANEEFQVCGNTCEPHCNNHEKVKKPCAGCVKNACTCKKGFVRDFDKECKMPKDCINFDEDK